MEIKKLEMVAAKLQKMLNLNYNFFMKIEILF